MIRRINHTGRKRISHEHVRIVADSRTKPPSFTADIVLASYKFPADARVVVEAYRSGGSLWSQFDWGRIAAVRKPPTGTLQNFDTMDGVLFRVRVIAVADPNKILGEADRVAFIPADADQGHRRSLIETVAADIGEVVWDVDFDADPPQLRINNALENWKVVAHDPAFRSLVYPALLREILVRVLFIEDWSDDSDEGDWQTRWLRFARTLAPGFPEVLDSEEDKAEFIDSACQSVAANLRAKDIFARYLNPDQRDES